MDSMCLLIYQLDLVTPGRSPLTANSLKHKRQIPKKRLIARGRPQRSHLRTFRVENLGLSLDFTMSDSFAIFNLEYYYLESFQKEVQARLREFLLDHHLR